MPKSYTRETFAKQSTLIHQWQELWPTPVYLGVVRYEYDVRSSFKQRSYRGNLTPNYRQLVKTQGWVPTTDCDDSIVECVCIPHDFDVRGPDGRLLATFEKRTAPSVTLIALDRELIGIVQSKLRQKLLNQDINLGVAAGEAGETSKMILATARRIRLAIAAVRRGKLITAVELLKAKATKKVYILQGDLDKRREALFQDTKRDLSLTKKEVHGYWLELQYGWKPLYNDIHGAAKAMANAAVEKQYQPTIRAASGDFRVYAVKTTDVEATHKITAKAWVRYRVKNDLIRAGNTLGLLNPAAIAWELVPFSFVADWFVNIGDYITELTTFAGLEVLDTGYSFSSEYTGVIKNNGTGDSRDYGRFSVKSYERRRGGLESPKLRWTINPFKNNGTRIANAAALIRQLTK